MAISSIPKMMTGVSIDKHGGSEVLQIKHDLLVPQPDDDQILIKTEYSGINFIDTYVNHPFLSSSHPSPMLIPNSYFRTGLYPAPSFPMTLGREVVGTISAISPTLSTQSGLSMHDKVVSLATGTYADYCIASATHTHRLAPTADSQQACAAFLQGLTALTLIREAYPVQRGDWVLVPAAAGGTGGKLVQLLCAVGARVIGTVSSEAKAQLVRGSCEEVVVVSPGGSYPDDETHPVVSRVMQLTAGRGVAAVFDGVGKATFESSFRCLARKGSLVSFGNASGAVPPVAIM